ncbi:small integral membrane protein 15-like [Cyprinus carpio]|uniref:Small integral membrane protein 15 n=2 Tax=Cyprinus carpio TaxID=7962 RepID=A0A8C1SR42_CYPCA|nr:small integral membrane protein 15-like [Cyprinus carpio]
MQTQVKSFTSALIAVRRFWRELPTQNCSANIERFIWICCRRRSARTMIDIKAWAEYVVEWAAKDPYGFLTTVILALTPLFIASALLSWKLAKMIEAKDREQKKKLKRQENIAKAKRAKKD